VKKWKKLMGNFQVQEMCAKSGKFRYKQRENRMREILVVKKLQEIADTKNFAGNFVVKLQKFESKTFLTFLCAKKRRNFQNPQY
jgi:hypothetical protein